MCGIAGVLAARDAPPVSRPLLMAMNAALRHRGPDDAGLWVAPGGHVGLAATRLAITDEGDGGAQPMRDAQGRFTLVFNGEIYNAPELRHVLAAEGYRFRSAISDAEVLLQAWARWGRGALKRLRGMFAFALWDALEGALWLVRDPFGVKPLCWIEAAGHVVFASEPGALFATGLVVPRASAQGVADWLSLMAVPPPRTLFEGVFCLPAGCWRRIDAHGRVREGRFADPLAVVEAACDPVAVPVEEVIDRVHVGLEEAMVRALPSDGAAAVMLSGGVDSGLIAEAAGRHRAAPTRYVTMSVQGRPAGDETEAAASTARRIGLPHEVIAATSGDIAQAIEALRRIRPDMPLATPDMALSHLFARRIAQDGIKVCFQGEGADETFGYPSHYAALTGHAALARFARRPAPVRAARLRIAGGDRRDELEAALCDPVFPARHIQAMGEAAKAALWCGESVAPSHETAGALCADIAGRSAETHLKRLVALEFRLRLPEFLLARSDLATMAAGVEARLPFLDLDFVQASLALPAGIRMRGGCAKWPLKALFARSVGEEHAFDRKQGYGRVLADFLAAEAQARLARTLGRRDDHPLYGYLAPKGVARLMAPGRRRQPYLLWVVGALADWLESLPVLAVPQQGLDCA